MEAIPNSSLERLIEAVQNSGEKTIVDYLLIAIPIVVSIIAVIISVHNTNQQNKIALFEKRFSVYSYIQKCLVFDRLLEDAKKPRDAYIAYCSAFGVKQGLLHVDDGWAILEYKQIEENLMQSYLLFDCLDDNTVKDCCTALLIVLKCIESDIDILENKQKYHSRMLPFYKAIPKIQDLLTFC